ncbi:hypothetical protein FBU30_011329 [Linnemannia zychae]|nr:hypothetical protein FBU30_011329 [Linnemannia zychae]
MIFPRSLIILLCTATLTIYIQATFAAANLKSSSHDNIRSSLTINPNYYPQITNLIDLAPTSNAIDPIDACSVLANTIPNNIKYQHVLDCYNSIPFNNTNAATTLATMLTIYKDYYVFTDDALTPELPSPFVSAPFDIIKELKKIGHRKYTSDFKFHDDIRVAINSLNDGHATYNADCYHAFTFAQDLILYAPVVYNTQAVHVYFDKRQRGYKDCTVNTINGEDALNFLRAYSRDVFGMSRDYNVRLNYLLGSQTYDKTKGQHILDPGYFAQRTTVPESSSIDYQLSCHNSTRPIFLHEEWHVLPATTSIFKDTTSFVENVCLSRPNSEEAEYPQARNHSHKFGYSLNNAKRFRPENDSSLKDSSYPGAEVLLSGNATKFYHLKDKPNIGVIVCHIVLADKGERGLIIEGLKAFHKRNVTKILLDLQANSGGSLAFSTWLVQLFFPNKHPLDAAFASEMRVTEPLQSLSRKSFNTSDFGIFNAHDFINLSNGTARYENNDLFDKPVILTHNGRHNLWTEKAALDFPSLSSEHYATVADFPWTNNAENIRILTDGRCVSACGMASYFWTAQHNVTAYTIGGTSGEGMSMFSFAGASVLELDQLRSFYEAANMTSPVAQLPYSGSVTFSWLRLYGHNHTIPLEYDAELYRSKKRIDFTPENSRDRVVLWNEVAEASWSGV